MRKDTLVATLVTTSLLLAPLFTPLAAQEVPPGVLSQQELSAYTHAHIALTSEGEAYQRQLGLTHDVIEQDRLRTELAEARASVLSEHDLSGENYELMTALISLDEGLRALFDALLEELTAN
jgi:hypothetical protein